MPKFSIIIPYRDREEHLKQLVPCLRNHAQTQGLDIEIIIAEQTDNNALRRGALRNEGARISSGDILVFHDVDYLPAPDVLYWPETKADAFRAVRRVNFVNMDGTPRPENDTPAGYRTFKDGIDDNFFGGVVSVIRHVFFAVNGYNPLYIGWGLEDDDFRERIRSVGSNIVDGHGTFNALPHPDSYKNDELFRHNQSLFANREKTVIVGLTNTTVDTKLNESKAQQYGVDKWIEVTNWRIFNPLTVTVKPQKIAKLDYGVFAVLDNVSNDHVQRAVATGQRWEPQIMLLCEKYVRPESTVVDIGANMGTFAVRLSQLVGEKGRVFSFEPQRIIFQQLCANLFLNNIRNVYAFPAAIGEKEKEVILTPIDYNLGAPGEVRIHGTEGEHVQCVSLDSFGLGNVSLIKIDVERYEPFVFDGARHTIENNRPIILFELTTLPLPDYPSDFVLKYLASVEYNVYSTSEWGDYIGIPKEVDENV